MGEDEDEEVLRGAGPGLAWALGPLSLSLLNQRTKALEEEDEELELEMVVGLGLLSAPCSDTVPSPFSVTGCRCQARTVQGGEHRMRRSRGPLPA